MSRRRRSELSEERRAQLLVEAMKCFAEGGETMYLRMDSEVEVRCQIRNVDAVRWQADMWDPGRRTVLGTWSLDLFAPHPWGCGEIVEVSEFKEVK